MCLILPIISSVKEYVSYYFKQSACDISLASLGEASNKVLLKVPSFAFRTSLNCTLCPRSSTNSQSQICSILYDDYITQGETQLDSYNELVLF